MKVGFRSGRVDGSWTGFASTSAKHQFCQSVNILYSLRAGIGFIVNMAIRGFGVKGLATSRALDTSGLESVEKRANACLFFLSLWNRNLSRALGSNQLGVVERTGAGVVDWRREGMKAAKARSRRLWKKELSLSL